MDLNMPNLGALVLKGPCCMFYTGCQVYWGLTHKAVSFWYSDFISHTHKYTQKHTEQSGPNRLTQPHKHILKPPSMRSQHISVLHWMNNSHIKNLLSTMSFLFKNYSHVEVVYMLTRFNKTKFILWNTNITDKNGANKQNTHTYTKHSKNDKGKRLGIPLF